MQPDRHDSLERAGRLAAWLSLRSRGAVYAMVALAVALSWALLLGMAAELAAAIGGPGAALTARLPAPELPTGLGAFLALCLAPSPGLPGFAALAAMWALMAVAMMLPTAAPMIRTYCDIAETAAARGMAVVNPLVLVAGYLAVWLGAAILFAGLTLMVAGRVGPGRAGPEAVALSSAVLAVAGLYQLSPLKHACLKKCREPFATLFARWSLRSGDIFRLGVGQGMWCLGCCWAMMLVMFAVGVMNVFWMALLSVFMLAEKELPGRAISWTGGAILLVWSAAMPLVFA